MNRYTVEIDSRVVYYDSWRIASPAMTIVDQGLLWRESKYGPLSLIIGIL